MNHANDSFVLEEQNYLNRRTTLASWLFTDDHKRIGVMFLFGVLFSLLLGGIFALLLRAELLKPTPDFMDALNYNRMFTLHGVTMVWLFMIPAIPSAFGNFFIPLMIGAKDVAFPTLNLISFYLYVIGSLVTIFGMYFGGADTGWTFYVPYSSTSPTNVIPVLVGVFILGFSTIITGLNFVTTIHTMRAPGVRWKRLPLFVWSIYGTSIIQLLATPVLGITLLLVVFERFGGFGVFDPSRGGDPLMYQHMFWFYSHPAVYIMVLPAFGVISEIVAAFAHKNVFGYPVMVLSIVGIAFVSFFTWGHHMFVSGQSTFASGIFGILSMFVAIFTSTKVFNWVFTLYRGQIAFTAPLLYVFGFLFLLIFGGMVGVAFATTSLNIFWHDTYMVVAHFHFIMVGAVLHAFLAALHYWFPKIFGRMFSQKSAMMAAAGVIFGFIATFVPQFLLGNMGMPRRYFTYPPEYQWLHVLSTAGAMFLGATFLFMAGYLGYALVRGPRASANPWVSAGFEWRSPLPPPKHNFTRVPAWHRDHHDYSEPVVTDETEHEARRAS